MMNTEDDFTGPVNIGNPHEFTVLELAQQVIELTHSRSKLVFRPLPDDDPRHRQPDISVAAKKAPLVADGRIARRAKENHQLL
jgi:UDP-glucuronate decarboxylase